MRQKGFAPILILLVLIGLGFLAYFSFLYKPALQPPTGTITPTTTPQFLATPDPITRNWKIFISNKYGFTIKYPQSIKPPEDAPFNTGLNPPASGEMLFNLPEVGNWVDNLRIIVWANPNKLQASEWVKQQRDEARKIGAPNIPPEMEANIEINGITAYQSINFAGDGSMKSTYFAKDNYIIEVSFYDTNPNITNQEQNKAIFETMLSTFSFTK